MVKPGQRGENRAARRGRPGLGKLFDQPFDPLEIVHLPQRDQRGFAVGSVERVQTGVDGAERDQRLNRKMTGRAVGVRSSMRGGFGWGVLLLRRPPRTGGERNQARGLGGISQPAQRDRRLRSDARRRIGEGRDDRRGIDSVEVGFAIRQRPQGVFAQRSVLGEPLERGMRGGSVKLLQGEECRDAAVRWLGFVRCERVQALRRLRRRTP